eukprot:CAMPEP_0178803260 /NCGR_PEP_ID=MMETSP0745-20121128/14366_1 /TAXON_ID=913974 /ORGANISM="Nitzschia punctata, Strain CCMP561" /LENGTH=37 /DNA_ID= /DNA_START= /DNA_END= /DNA_ORIENTATION=
MTSFIPGHSIVLALADEPGLPTDEPPLSNDFRTLIHW